MILHLMRFKLNLLEFNLNLAKQLTQKCKMRSRNSKQIYVHISCVHNRGAYVSLLLHPLFFFSSLVLTLAMLSVLVPSLKILFLLTLLLCISLYLLPYILVGSNRNRARVAVSKPDPLTLSLSPTLLPHQPPLSFWAFLSPISPQDLGSYYFFCRYSSANLWHHWILLLLGLVYMPPSRTGGSAPWCLRCFLGGACESMYISRQKTKNWL